MTSHHHTDAPTQQALHHLAAAEAVLKSNDAPQVVTMYAALAIAQFLAAQSLAGKGSE